MGGTSLFEKRIACSYYNTTPQAAASFAQVRESVCLYDTSPPRPMSLSPVSCAPLPAPVPPPALPPIYPPSPSQKTKPQAPLLPYMVKQLGADASYYGLLQSSFSGLQLLGGLLSGAGGVLRMCGCVDPQSATRGCKEASDLQLFGGGGLLSGACVRGVFRVMSAIDKAGPIRVGVGGGVLT
jgi:hypothetical protein